jgi:hypothetical protein
MAAYDGAGRLDTRFGTGGKAKIEHKTDKYGRVGMAVTPDGRLMLGGGPNFAAARFFHLGPQVQIAQLDPNAAETRPTERDDSGWVTIQRDGAYDYATRVYLTVNGTATPGGDYNSTL